MADLAPNNSRLGATNPKIVIIPPSPRKGSSREETENEPSTVTYSEDDSRQKGANESKASSFKILEDQSAEEVKDAGTQAPEQPSECEKDEESDAVFTNVTVETRFKRCRKAWVSFNESKCMLIFRFLQLGVPILTGFMGADYLTVCSLNSETFLLLFVMVITGAIVVLGQMLLSQKIKLPPRNEYEALRMAIIIANPAIILYMVRELFSSSSTDPSFEIGSEEYCMDLFYKYTNWMNCFIIIIVSFLVLLLLPNCSAVALQSGKNK